MGDGLVRPVPGSIRNGLPEWRPYVYQGTGCDELTGWMTQQQMELDTLNLTGGAGPAEAAALFARRYDADRQDFLLLMCQPCWDDDCSACRDGTCKCACRDEPAPDPRCDACGYIKRGANHKLICGETSS
jgi:hypothetical protein